MARDAGEGAGAVPDAAQAEAEAAAALMAEAMFEARAEMDVAASRAADPPAPSLAPPASPFGDDLFGLLTQPAPAAPAPAPAAVSDVTAAFGFSDDFGASSFNATPLDAAGGVAATAAAGEDPFAAFFGAAPAPA